MPDDRPPHPKVADNLIQSSPERDCPPCDVPNQKQSHREEHVAPGEDATGLQLGIGDLHKAETKPVARSYPEASAPLSGFSCFLRGVYVGVVAAVGRQAC